ncbi:CASP C terminal-domain-containing protein [Lactarius hengduanensis]|nr:CASP C terminal-domain-containing protein [Lactarius hengduanensis]
MIAVLADLEECSRVATVAGHDALAASIQPVMIPPVVDDAFTPSPDALRVPVTTTTILVNNVPPIQFFAMPTDRERVVLSSQRWTWLLQNWNVQIPWRPPSNVELLRAEIESLKTGNNDSVKYLELQNVVTAAVESNARKAAEEHAREASNAAREIEQLRLSLRGYADYDEIKRGLEIVKYVGFAGLEGDLDEEDGFTSDNQLGLQLPNPNASKANAHPASSLEALLATKNKSILEELTKFRILHTELEASLQRAQDDLADPKLTCSKSNHGNGDATPADPAGGDVLTGLGLELGLATKTPSNNDLSAQAKPIPFTPSADMSILPIVTSQRDRFRQRNAELEEELRKQFQVISELRAEIRSLQSDNLKLYEKVRYMQSYREGSAHSTLDPLPASSTSAPSTTELTKYSARYEAAMNPRGIPWSPRAYSDLNPLERGVLVLTRAVLGNRRARNAFIVYAVGLHALVMFTL